ncbi:MAG TPA: protoporphyrinogen oxidase HemJ [Gammaproteobacteria bacterium]|nr:protoporphyrinogen oxidase HemJ [Gammaproteobacteria bacterium]
MLWVKAFHLVFMVTWFAGLFYLPRLFVYHAEARDEAGLRRFVVMERRLFAIMSLGAIGTLCFGIWLLLGWFLPMPGWLHVKLGLVVLLLLYHFYCYFLMRGFRLGRNRHGARFYRWFNEFPGLLLVAIVLLAVLKPHLSP